MPLKSLFAVSAVALADCGSPRRMRFQRTRPLSKRHVYVYTNGPDSLTFDIQNADAATPRLGPGV